LTGIDKVAMSLPDKIPPNEEQVMEVMRNLFTSEYALEKPDRELVFRFMQYGKDKVGLEKEEIALLQKKGLMDKDETFIDRKSVV
jgi:viroplasmin and RNaseH domain-containing protein